MSIGLKPAIWLTQNTPKLSRIFFKLYSTETIAPSGLQVIVTHQLVRGIKDSPYGLGIGYAVQQGSGA